MYIKYLNFLNSHKTKITIFLATIIGILSFYLELPLLTYIAALILIITDHIFNLPFKTMAGTIATLFIEDLWLAFSLGVCFESLIILIFSFIINLLADFMKKFEYK